MPPQAAVKRKRQRKRKRRNDISSDSDSDSDSDASSSIQQQIVKAPQQSTDVQGPDSDDSDSSSDSSGSSSSEQLFDKTSPAKQPDDVKMADAERDGPSAARRDSRSPSPPPLRRVLPTFLPEDAGSQAEKATQQQLKEKFRKFWMERMAAGFKGDLEQIQKVYRAESKL